MISAPRLTRCRPMVVSRNATRGKKVMGGYSRSVSRNTLRV